MSKPVIKISIPVEVAEWLLELPETLRKELQIKQEKKQRTLYSDVDKEHITKLFNLFKENLNPNIDYMDVKQLAVAKKLAKQSAKNLNKEDDIVAGYTYLENILKLLIDNQEDEFLPLVKDFFDLKNKMVNIEKWYTKKINNNKK